MSKVQSTSSDYTAALTRWKGLGPYYAMFPVDFAFDVVAQYSPQGGGVLDPFAGRASSIVAACAQERYGLGIEINPVGWIYGKVKLRPASMSRVVRRVREIDRLSRTSNAAYMDSLPPFFFACYELRVLRFLVAARAHLNWKHSRVDRTLMAILLVYLHGKIPQSLSNQMRQGKAMAPDYSVRWWAERGMLPPDIDPVAFLTQRVKWRYAKGIPEMATGQVVLQDSTKSLRLMRSAVRKQGRGFDLLFTSPPYCGITNYHYDQWLRLWLLGGNARHESDGTFHRGKFEGHDSYRNLLKKVFADCAKVMVPDAVVYVRTDAREFTLTATTDALKTAFPNKQMTTINQPFLKETQTHLFGDKNPKPGEVDIVLR